MWRFNKKFKGRMVKIGKGQYRLRITPCSLKSLCLNQHLKYHTLSWKINSKESVCWRNNNFYANFWFLYSVVVGEHKTRMENTWFLQNFLFSMATTSIPKKDARAWMMSPAKSMSSVFIDIWNNKKYLLIHTFIV